jgi:hypothetical protein
VLLLRRLCPGGPRAETVAMFGHTGLGMLICRIAGVALSHIYALTWMSPTTVAITNSVLSFLSCARLPADSVSIPKPAVVAAHGLQINQFWARVLRCWRRSYQQVQILPASAETRSGAFRVTGNLALSFQAHRSIRPAIAAGLEPNGVAGPCPQYHRPTAPVVTMTQRVSANLIGMLTLPHGA